MEELSKPAVATEPHPFSSSTSTPSNLVHATIEIESNELIDPAPDAPSPAGPDDGDFFDSDSAYGGSNGSVMTDTASLNSSIARFREENGRTYHAYGSTEHWGPNDEDAKDQQDLSHHLWTLILEGELYIAPVINPQRILDLGTGTGIWVMDVAEANPQADVKGIDLSPIQPAYIPPNARFEIDDYNLEWLDQAKFDLIHQRELLGTAKDWHLHYTKCLEALKPGGWVDAAEPSLFFRSAHETPDSIYQKWGDLMTEAGQRSGMIFDVAERLKGFMEGAGFINIIERKIPVTIGRWSKDRKQREIGLWNQVRLEQGVSDFSMRRFTAELGWTADEVQVFCAKLRTTFRNPELLGYQWFYFVAGQKPI